MRNLLSCLVAITLFTFFNSCTKELSTEYGQPASGTLQSSAGDCLPKTVEGSYIAAKPLIDSNFIEVTVNVLSPGPYSIYTDSVNGYSFKASGAFSTTGSTKVKLKGSGTPASSGVNNFIVFFDSSFCMISVTVLPGGSTVVLSDYFPLSANSYWTYDDIFSPGDTTKKVNNATATNGGNTYRVFEVFDNAGTSDHDEYYRRTGNDYLEYNIGDYYSITTFDTNVEGDILFLKEGLATNQTWTSAEYSGTDGGIPTRLRYVFKCIDANATVTVNGKSYSNVYKVTMTPEYSTNGGTTWTAEALLWENWYAKGVGLVQQKVSFGTTVLTGSLRFYQVF